MTLKSFVTNQVRAVWLRNDLSLVQDESFPFQRRVAVHVTTRLAQLDATEQGGLMGRREMLKKISSDEEYSLSTAPNAATSAVYASRLVLRWIEAYSVIRQDPDFYELVDASLWDFINGVLTPGQVAELMGIPDPNPPYFEEAQPELTSSKNVSQDIGLQKEGDKDHVK